MSARIFIVFLVSLVLPTPAFTQSTLNFPKLFTAAELQVSGFALVNPNSTAASVTYTLYSATGTVVSTSTQTYGPGTQRARTGSDLFPSAGNGGWVRATSTATGLQAFWLNYDGGLTHLDGAAAVGAAVDEVIPLVAGNTELNVANPNTLSQSVTLRLVGEAGTDLGSSISRTIAANGVFQGNASTLFGASNIANARYIRVTGTLPVAAAALIRGYLVPTESAVVNGVDRSSTTRQLNFPQAVSGIGAGGNYTTVLGVTNLSSAAQTLSITFTTDSGAATTITRQLSGGGGIRDTLGNLFNFTPATFQSGWIRVTGTSAITGFVAYADSVAGGLAVVPVQPAPQSGMIFAHIADLSPWMTGIALLNPNSSAATVKVYAMTPEGALIGGADNVPTAQFVLAPGTKTARLLRDFVPQTSMRASDGGFVFITSTQPLFGAELFFSGSLNILANVTAGSLPAGVTFTPPAVVPAVTINVNPASVAPGEQATLTWSSRDVSACIGIGAWGGSQALSGSLPVSQDAAGTVTFTLTCSGGFGTASASTTLTTNPPGSGTSEGVSGLPSDVSPLFSIAGSWRPVNDRFIDKTVASQNAGFTNDIYGGNITLPNGREGIVLNGHFWKAVPDTFLTPIDMTVIEQQENQTMEVATSRYVSNPENNGGNSVIVADFNKDGTEDFALPAYNERPFMLADTIAYLSNSSGGYDRKAIPDQVLAHGSAVATINGTPTLFTASYCWDAVPCTATAAHFNGTDFTVAPTPGLGGGSGVTVGDFLGDGTFAAVYSDLNYGPNYPHTNRTAIIAYRLSGLVATGNPIRIGPNYFDGKPQYAQFPGWHEPFTKTHNYRVRNDDFNYDGKLDILVQGGIWTLATGWTKNILQMYQNQGNYQFSDVTNSLNPQYDENSELTDYNAQIRDIDRSGINSYLFGSRTFTTTGAESAGNYIFLNDGAGNLQVALHEVLNSYAVQARNWLAARAAPATFVSPTQTPAIRAYMTPNGLINFLALVSHSLRISQSPQIFVASYTLINLPLQLDVTTQFVKPLVVRDRNGSHRIRTFAGNDTIYSGNNNGYSSVDGGIGINTLVYSGPSTNYSIARNADNTWTVKDNVGRDGTDTLIRIQQLQFADSVVPLN